MSEEQNDFLTIWMPAIIAFIASALIYLLGKNQDNNFYSDWGSRLFQPGFLELMAIVFFIVMFLILRSSGKKTAKKKAKEQNKSMNR